MINGTIEWSVPTQNPEFSANDGLSELKVPFIHGAFGFQEMVEWEDLEDLRHSRAVGCFLLLVVAGAPATDGNEDRYSWAAEETRGGRCLTC